MCSQRIDAAYSHLSSIDEKKNPEDRFIQLKEELSLDSEVLHHLKINSLTSFHDWFIGNEDITKAVIEGQKHSTVRDKVAAYVKHSYPCRTFGRDMDLFYKGHDISHDLRRNSEQKQKIEFLIELAKSFYPDSFYELYSSEFGRIFSLSFLNLSTIFRDKEYCFSEELFNDPSLNQLETAERTDFLWSIFNDKIDNIIYINRKLPMPSDYKYELLVDFIKAKNNDPSNANVAKAMNNGFRFLKAWIKHDAKNARPFSELTSIIEELRSYLSYRLFSEMYEENNEVTLFWCQNLNLDLQQLLLENYDLSKATERDAEAWSNLVESVYTELLFKGSNKDDLTYTKRCHLALNKLTNLLPSNSIDHWIKNNICQDIKNILDKDSSNNNSLQSKWCFGDTYESWKAEFLSQLDQLNPVDQMKVLSDSAPYQGLPYEISEDESTFYSKHSLWWKSLYLELPKGDHFEKKCLPDWTITAKNKAGTPDLVPYIDQSIGILRGQVFNEGSDAVNGKLMQQLSELLTWLEHGNPEKALRHRLILFRSSKTPLCDEGLNYRTKAEDCLWYQPLKDLKPSFNHSTTGSANEVLLAFYQAMSQQISEFCLSRLQLRKKEKAVDGKYSSNQVVEMSPTWRQGYLKAITEIGLDLNGKAHKAAYFIKQGDEDENVRAIAAETYKAVRRSDNNNPSIADLKRGVIAAEWWLLHCQRQELGLDINFDEALKTRRRLLRNP